MAKKQAPEKPKTRSDKKASNLNIKTIAAKRNKRSIPATPASSLKTRTKRDSRPARQERPRDKPFLIAGIGASAGGLEACTKLLENLSPDTGMAFVLVQHLAPTQESILSELLSKTTSMPVHEVRDGIAVEPNHVYVIPPNTELSIFHGALQLQPRAESPLQHLPVDAFFRSLAEDQAQNAVAIILSGTGSDGSLGIRAVKAEGGLVFAQDERSAKYDGMPKSAAATGVVDYILPAEKIAVELGRISRHLMSEPPAVKAGAQPQAGEDDLNRIFMLLRSATGVDFTYYKQATILRRINRRMLLHKLDALEQYVRYLRENPGETGMLYQDILINVTSFFRDPETFTALKNIVFPRMIENRPADTPLRIWVPGCSTGEEAYSLAMCFSEFCGEHNVFPQVQFFASDIDEAAIEKARQGIYPENIAQDVSPERLRSFFTKAEQGYQISKAIREQCVFARQNLVKDPPFSKMDLISCRNLMIYFGPALQKKALPVMHYALNPSGYLMLGRSESIGEFSGLFSLVDKNNRIYSKKTSAAGPRFAVERDRVREKPGLMKKAAEPGGPDIQKAADSIVLNRYSPPGIVVNEDMDILQFRGNISPFLKPRPGKASLNLMKMAGESLAMELRALVHQAAGKNAPVRREGIQVRQNGAVAAITIEVTAFKAPDSRERLFLIVFEQGALSANVKKTGKRPASAKGGPGEDAVALISRELAATQQQLKSIVAAHDASTEEQKALNEEVQSSNEELQSINEELETSKEELQSTNEELNTVNDELRSRNEEITEINNDLVNFLSGADIPILLIGNRLQIRRFNVSAGKALNLIASDIGRPITDIRPTLIVPDLAAIILDVIDSLSIHRQEVQDLQGRWHSMAIRPYKTVDNRIDGAIVTIEDIDDLKQGMLRIQEARAYAEAIVETVREPLVILNKDLRVVTANKAYYANFATTADALRNGDFLDQQDGIWNIPGLRKHLEDTTRENSPFSDFEVEYDAAGAGRRIVLLNGRRIAREGSELMLLAIEDITARRAADENILALNADLQNNNFNLENANKELEVLAYSLANDLGEPLRFIKGFAKILTEDYQGKLDAQGNDYLARIRVNSVKMEQRIEALLRLSKISRQEMERTQADLSRLASTIISHLRAAEPGRSVEVVIAKELIASADLSLMKTALTHLFENAWKFTAKTAEPRIEFGASETEGKTVYSLKDNGAGFDQQYADRLFQPFQRLHADHEFEGTGIGLAIVERVISRHGGRIWAEGKSGEGAAFYFTLT